MITNDELISIGLTPNKVMVYKSFPNKINGAYIIFNNGVCRFQSKHKDIKKYNINNLEDLIDFIYSN